MSKSDNDWFFSQFDWNYDEPRIPGPGRFMAIVLVTLVIVLTIIGVML